MVQRRHVVRPQMFRRGGGGSGLKMRLVMGLMIAAVAVCSFLGSRSFNPVTGEDQYISLTTDQEIAMGLQAAPEMIQTYGGLYPDQQTQDLVDQVGYQIVQNSSAGQTDWQFDFHVLNDPETINAFALPGGPVFITSALLSRLETEGQLAGVLGHEIGHVVARHSAQRIAQQNLSEGLIGAVVVAGGDYGQQAGQAAVVISQMVNMSYGRDDELQSDQLGVRFMSQAGYDPRAMINVMQILAEAGGGSQPEFFSTHPNPENRIQRIEEAIQAEFPDGVPEGLTP
ncbi:MAG TPA: M48 family metallopeptidase [Anaerolineae bacterium]|nr:M48 family metallopeptidase [Anaerolineae bacterium]HMR66374.1 M48 family metallopeptidase [Anaerolineae bacterium]